MKVKILKSMLLSMAITCSQFSCVNGDYDLSDVDTTVGMKINDLTIPLNLDELTLRSVLELEDDSQIKEVNGEYAVIEDGTFSSDGIELPSFVIEVPAIEPIQEELTPDLHLDDLIPEGFNPSFLPLLGNITIPDDYKVVSFDIENASTTFHVEAEVDESIVGIDKVGTEATIRIFFNFDGIENLVNSFELENLVIQLPKGLSAQASEGGTYDPVTGKLSFEKMASNEKLEVLVNVDITEIQAKPAGATLANGKFTFSNELSVNGIVVVYGHNLKKDVKIENLLNIGNISYECQVGFPNGNIKVESFTGDIQYQVDGIDIDPVNLDDIPDYLAQEGTNIKLANPQIYLELNNPLYEEHHIYATTALEFIPYPNNTGERFKVDVKIDDALNQFCFSPAKPESYYKNAGNEQLKVDFTDAEFVPFTNLGNILSGEKIPESIDINVVNPQIPVQHVENFALGQTLGAIQGTYVFYAPLALTEGSVIKYSEVFDGWSDEELDNIAISQLRVDANITSNIPFELALKAYPIDKNGQKITNNGKVIEGKIYMKGFDVIPANANGSLVIEIDGAIQQLDGIILDAEIHGKDVAGSTGNALKPNHQIKLDNLKMKVSGEYISEL